MFPFNSVSHENSFIDSSPPAITSYLCMSQIKPINSEPAQSQTQKQGHTPFVPTGPIAFDLFVEGSIANANDTLSNRAVYPVQSYPAFLAAFGHWCAHLTKICLLIFV